MQIKLNLMASSVTNFTEDALEFILDLFRQVHAGGPGVDDTLPFTIAARAIPLDSDKEFIIQSLLGELLGKMIQDVLPQMQPPGVDVNFKYVEYAVPQERLAPPEGVEPQVILVGNRTSH